MLLVVCGDSDIECPLFRDWLFCAAIPLNQFCALAHMILRFRALPPKFHLLKGQLCHHLFFQLWISKRARSSTWIFRHPRRLPKIFSSHSATWMMELLRQFWCLRHKSGSPYMQPEWWSTHWSQSSIGITFSENQWVLFGPNWLVFLLNQQRSWMQMTPRITMNVKEPQPALIIGTPKRHVEKQCDKANFKTPNNSRFFTRRWQQPSRAATTSRSGWTKILQVPLRKWVFMLFGEGW